MGKDDAKVAYLVDECSFTRKKFQTLMEILSRENAHYFVLKILKPFLIAQIKLIQLDDKVVNYIFNYYPKGVKGYELWEVEYGGSKFIIYRCITFSESR